MTETDDFVGEEKAALLAVGPRYNGAGVEIVCHPTPLDIIVLYSSKRDEMVCLVTSRGEKDFGEEKKKSALFGNSLHSLLLCSLSSAEKVCLVWK